jgi:uncharacterized membrane protein
MGTNPNGIVRPSAARGGRFVHGLAARLRAAADWPQWNHSDARHSAYRSKEEVGHMTEDSSAGSAGPQAVAAAVTDGAYTLLVADFDSTDTAWEAYQDLKTIEDGATVAIEGVIVVKRDAGGELEVQKATDHSTRSGLTWGAVGGVVLGVLFPPSIIGSAAVLGAAGAGAGKLRELHHRKELAEELQTAVAPGHSGLVALVSDPGEVRIRKALERANHIVESAVGDAAARDIKAAAKDAGPTEPAKA